MPFYGPFLGIIIIIMSNARVYNKGKGKRKGKLNVDLYSASS